MAHLQYMPGDPRLVDQLVYELKSKGIFDQFRKDCIADVDTRPAYQNLRQRVENSVATFLSRQCWVPDLNKNQLREKLRKHILDGNYLEQGVERIVDQVVNPKVASVFIPQVEDLVYNFLGITRKKSTPVVAETSNGKPEDLLPTDLEAVSPGSVKSNDDKYETIDMSDETKDDSKMEVDEEEPKPEVKEDPSVIVIDKEKENQESQMSITSVLTSNDSEISIDKSKIPLPDEEIKLENIQPPENSPPKIELDKIELPKDIVAADIPMPEDIPKIEKDNIPLPEDIPKDEKDVFFKPVQSDDDDSSSDSSLRRNMSPLTPIRNFNNENSYDAQQAFDNDSGESKGAEKKEPSSFRFTIESKSSENSSDGTKVEKKETEQAALSYQFNNQININTFNTPLYDDSSNSNNLQIDYESDANSKNVEVKVPESDPNTEETKKERKPEEKKSSHKSSHRSRDSHRHSSSKDKRSDSKQSTSRDSSRHDKDKKSSKDEHKSKSSYKESSRDRSDKKDSRDSSKHRSSHRSSSHKDSKSHKSSSSSNRHSSKHDDKKPSSSHKERSDKDKSSSDKTSSSRDRSSRDSKSSSHRSDRDKKSSSKKHDDKDKEKKEKKDTDDHYSLSGRGNHSRRSTDRDSNDGSSSSKGSHNQPSSKSAENKKDSKTSAKSDNTSTSSDSTSPCDGDHIVQASDSVDKQQTKPIVRVENHLETPFGSPPRLPFVPDVTLKKPKIAANLQEAKRLMKMRKFLDEEQKRMNQEAALLLEFQANVRPSLSQVYSNIPGPELEFACVINPVESTKHMIVENHNDNNNLHYAHNETEVIENGNESTNQKYNVEYAHLSHVITDDKENKTRDLIAETLTAMHGDENANHDVIIKTAPVQQYTENVQDIAATLEEHNGIDCNVSKQEDISKCNQTESQNETIDNENEAENKEEIKKRTEYFEVTIITEELSESEDNDKKEHDEYPDITDHCPDEDLLHHFAEHEKYMAELERDKFAAFLKLYIEKAMTDKMYLINCDTYEESIVREVSANLGRFEIVNYYRNGHLKLSKQSKNVVKDINVTTEIALPLEKHSNDVGTPFSPVKSECSFELSSDYDAKLEEMVNKTSRKEIMEIILGSAVDESPTKMPTIDYCMDSNIEDIDNPLKRKIDMDALVNNNRLVLTPNKIRRLSGSDQISSTTEEIDPIPTSKVQNSTRSKYLGRAKRVGLPKPRRPNVANSPSSDKSVENYDQDGVGQTQNGRVRTPQRTKVQRYDTSDLYKPKLHYLSRRNNIT